MFCVNGKLSKSFYVDVCLLQRCVLSSLFFIICQNWIEKFSRIGEYVTIVRSKINQLHFADNLVCWLPLNWLSRALNGVATACDINEIKTRTSKTEVLHLSRTCPMFSASWQNIIEAGKEVSSILGSHF